MKQHTRAVFFDLDGTLWNAIDSLVKSWNDVMKEEKYPLEFSSALMISLMGLTPRETVEKLFKDLSFEDGMKMFKKLLARELEYLAIHPGQPYPHDMEVLKKLGSKYPLYIVSNCDKGYIETYLKALNMEKYFSGHLCQGDTSKDKWENILLLKEKVNVKDVIYVGDTLKDYEECKKANIPFIHASYGFGVINNPPYKINNLLELEDVVEHIFNN